MISDTIHSLTLSGHSGDTARLSRRGSRSQGVGFSVGGGKKERKSGEGGEGREKKGERKEKEEKK